MNIRPIVLLLLAAAALPAAVKKPKPPPKFKAEELEKLSKHMTGVFDFTKNPRPFIALLILDQEGNRYPSYWAGGNVGGKPTITAENDWLEGHLVFSQEGSYTCQLVNAPHKPGMETQIPGGAWKENLKENQFKITIDSIDDMKITGVRKGTLFVDCAAGAATGKDPKLYTVEGTCTGSVSVLDKTAPFEGKIALTFLSTISMFAVRATFDFPGTELGLEGEKGEGIKATFYTASTATTSRPDPTATKDSLPLKLK